MSPLPDAMSVLQEALDRLPQVGAVAVCHVLAVSGSTPCRAGWRKLLTPGGESFGNLGGGSFEARVLADARGRLAGSRRDLRRRYYFTEQATRGEATGMSCGGFAEVWIEIMTTNPVLIVCGGGPVGRALAANARLCGFEVTVADDRSEFVDPDMHPGCRCVQVAADHSDLPLENLADRDLYVCVVSRSWDTDATAVARVLSADPALLRYLGLMGSRRKIDKVRRHLDADDEDWERVHAPIGLEIGAETPTEIAVSILAELIAVRRQLDADPSSD